MIEKVKKQVKNTRQSKIQLMCLDLETMTVHNVLKIDYESKRVTMQNDESGCTSNKFKNVMLLTKL